MALPERSLEEIAAIEAENGLRQFDRMIELIDQYTGRGPRFKLRPSTIGELNRLAVQDMVERPGMWRDVSIEITAAAHAPPHHLEVPREIDEMCEYVQSYWGDRTPIHLASYAMWRGRVDVSEMEKLLQAHLEAQLADIRIQAVSGHRDDVE